MEEPDPLIPFMGRKERRRSSAGKLFLGDHAGLRGSPEVLKFMAKHGETSVLFSEQVLKINRRHEAVPRVFLVADSAVYLLNAETHRIHRKIPLRAVECVRMSELPDNFVAIVNPAEYDSLVVCSRKIEAVAAMSVAYLALTGSRLDVQLGNQLTYRAGANVTKVVAFTRGVDDGDVDAAISDAPAAMRE